MRQHQGCQCSCTAQPEHTCLKYPYSFGMNMAMAVPARPARPVRPLRCRKFSASCRVGALIVSMRRSRNACQTASASMPRTQARQCSSMHRKYHAKATGLIGLIPKVAELQTARGKRTLGSS